MGLPSRVASLLPVAAVLPFTLLAGSAQEPTFKAVNRTVALYATVTGSDGRLVPNLTRDSFTVLDNGKPADITLFANDIQPITVVMLLDRSGSMRANFSLVQKAAEAFVTALLPSDRARIGSFSFRIQIDPPTFTSDRDELLKILRTELQEEGPTPLWNAVNVGITSLLRQEGRRVVLVFTDGADRPLNPAGSNISHRDVMKRAAEEDVMVYAIGLAGQQGFAGGPAPGAGRRRGGIGIGGIPGIGGGWGGGMGRGPGMPGGGDAGPDVGLPRLAAATGGGYFELTSTNDLAATFARVADELHHQYAIGFTPAVLDGKMHTLEVKVSAPGATVRARRSYLAKPMS